MTVQPMDSNMVFNMARRASSSSISRMTRCEMLPVVASWRSRIAAGLSVAGSSRVTVVPSPEVDAMRIRPPDWVTKPNTMLSPRPVPWADGFVVKKGSKA